MNGMANSTPAKDTSGNDREPKSTEQGPRPVEVARTASASSAESLKSPFASMMNAADELCIDDYLDEEEADEYRGVSDEPGSSARSTQGTGSASRRLGSNLVSTPSLPWSENSFGRSSMTASSHSLCGDYTNMAQAYSRGLDSVASTRASSLAVPSIPEGMERAGSIPTHDVMPSPFSNPVVQTHDEMPPLNRPDPRTTLYNPLISGLKSLSGSEANLYMQLTEELSNDSELAELLANAQPPAAAPSAASSATASEGGAGGGAVLGPNSELLEKLRALLPTESMKELLGQLGTEAAARHLAALKAAAANANGNTPANAAAGNPEGSRAGPPASAAVSNSAESLHKGSATGKASPEATAAASENTEALPSDPLPPATPGEAADKLAAEPAS